MMRDENIERYLGAIEKVLNGDTWRKAGEGAGISPERLRQIWGNTRRMMMHPKRLDEPLPDHDYWDVNCVRAHKDFWLRRINKLREEKGSNLNSTTPPVA